MGQFFSEEAPPHHPPILPDSPLSFQRKIGQGHFGVVYEGHWDHGFLRGSTRVAIKTFRIDVVDKKRHREIFKKEALFMRSLQHPRLIKLIGLRNECGYIYIVTEFMQNGSLRDYLPGKQSTLGFGKLVNFAAQVAEGMAYLASKGCVHRDLAARNILVESVNNVKIADFGLARVMDGNELSDYNTYTNTIGYQGYTGGPFPFLWTAPEAIISKLFTVKSDVWSFGILLYEMASYGGEPYPEITDKERVLSHLREGYRMTRPKGCTSDVYQLMMSCWEEDPKQRPNFSRLHQKLLALRPADSDGSWSCPIL